MATWLKQSTAVDIAFGPFLDSSDGNTVESALTITQPDIRLKKNGGAWAQKSAAQTLSHEENGWYEISLSTTDTDTLGILIVAVHESGALPVWREFNVVPANVFDSLFSTDLLQVDLTQWLGVAPNALASGRVDASAGALANNVITDAAIAASAISDIRSVAIGTADSGSTTTVVDTERTETGTDYWKGCLIVFGSTLAGQTRLITGFNPATDTITFAPATTVAVGAGHPYEILPAARADVHLWAGSAVNALVSGRVDASVGAIAADAINAAAIASDAITAAKIASDAITAAKVADGTIDAATFAAGAINAAAIAAGAIDDDAVAADMDSYAAKMWVIRNSTTADEYGVTFYKNGQPLESGITSPVIDYVKKLSNASVLVDDATLTDQGNGDYFYSEGTNKLVAGSNYMMRVTATIDGSSRVFKQQLGRDAT